MQFRGDSAAALLAGFTGLALLLGAWGFQYLAGLAPCEMCIWQRWPHGAAAIIGLGCGVLLLTGLLPKTLARSVALLAIFAVAVSGAIGVFHAGVEWKLWPGPAACTGLGYVPGADFGALKLVRCDEAQWRLLGVSLAGYNAILSLGVAAFALRLMRQPQAKTTFDGHDDTKE